MQKRGLFIVFMIILVLGILFSFWNYSKKSPIENSYDSKGWKLYRERKYQDAIEEFNRNLIKNNRNPYAYEGVAESYLALSYNPYSSDYSGVQDYSKKAIEAFRKSLEYEPNQITEYIGLGRALFRYSVNDENAVDTLNMKEFIEAKQFLSKAVDIDPRNPEPYSILGHISLLENIFKFKGEEGGDFSETIRIFNTSIFLKPSSNAYVGLGKAYLYSYDFENAIASYKNAIELDENNAEALTRLGWAYYWLNDADSSLKYFEKSMNMAPDYYLNHLGIGRVKMVLLNDSLGAIPYFKKAVELNPYEPTNLGNLGDAYFLSGQYDKSIEFFDKTIQLDPDAKSMYSDYYAYRGLALIQLGEFQKAIEPFNKMLKLNPGRKAEMFSLIGLVVAYSELGETEAAYRYIPKIIELNMNRDTRMKNSFLLKKFNSCMNNKPYDAKNVHDCGKNMK